MIFAGHSRRVYLISYYLGRLAVCGVEICCVIVDHVMFLCMISSYTHTDTHTSTVKCALVMLTIVPTGLSKTVIALNDFLLKLYIY